MTATVIIPTTGSPELRDAVDSVLAQTYPTTCYVVVDGPQYMNKVYELLGDVYTDTRFKICTIPLNVGANGFYGHRVYAAFTHLINTDYVLYLDQDNWFERNHVQTCVEHIEKNKLDWCYSLRNIYSKDSQFICQDNCESLGKWQTYHGVHHVDTNSYCIKTNIAIQLAQVWHGGWGQDRVFLQAISKYFPNYDCTRDYTSNYRVDGGKGSVTADFFINGNKVMNGKYNGDFPWNKKEMSLSASSPGMITIKSKLG
jgi:glycosyltransferase involved in cell wall biosynthesis